MKLEAIYYGYGKFKFENMILLPWSAMRLILLNSIQCFIWFGLHLTNDFLRGFLDSNYSVLELPLFFMESIGSF